MSAGVYRLEHVPTGRFYIGSSMRVESRCVDWLRALVPLCAGTGLEYWRRHGVNRRFEAAVAGTVPGDWVFVVVERHPEGVARSGLLRAELAHIARSVRDFPDLCLNTWAPGRYDRRKPRSDRQRAWNRPGV